MRKALALLLLAALTASAGCSSFLGPGPVDEEALADGANYEWSESRSGYLELNEDNYTSVYRVGNRTTGDLEDDDPTIELYTRDMLGTDQPLEISAVQFRYPNGTVLAFESTGDGANLVKRTGNGTEDVPDGLLYVNKTRKRTVVHLPVNNTGQVAYTTSKTGKEVSTPTFVRGNYEMVLPERAEISVPLLAQVRPSRSGAERIDGQIHVYWDNVESPSLSVRYYLQRDLLLFAALVGGMAITGVVGTIYYAKQIRKTRRKREEVGLDVDTGDDDEGSGPPPGMR